MKKIVVFVLVLAVLSTAVFAAANRQSSAGGLPGMGAAIYRYDDTFMSYMRNTIEQLA